METEKLSLRPLTTGALLMLLLAGAGAAQSAEVIFEGNNATGIEGLELDGEYYDVDFVFDSSDNIYGTPVTDFDFNTRNEATAALVAVKTILNGEPAVQTVGPQNSSSFNIGADEESGLIAAIVGEYQGSVGWDLGGFFGLGLLVPFADATYADFRSIDGPPPPPPPPPPPGEGTVIFDGNKATGIRGLELQGEFYDVDFVFDSSDDIYGPRPDPDFDFPSEDPPSALAARDAVVALLSSEPAVELVGPEGGPSADLFAIGFDVENDLIAVAEGGYYAPGPGPWFDSGADVRTPAENTVYADFRVSGGPPPPPSGQQNIASLVLEDIDGSGDAEAATFGSNDGVGQVIIKDSASGDAVATVDASDGLAPVDAEVIADANGNGSDDIAFLLLAATDSQPKVEVRDPLTNARIKNVDYSKQHDPVALAIMADQNGNQSEEGLVLAKQLNQNDRPRLLIRDLSTKDKVSNVSLPKSFDPIDVVMGPDLNGNGSDDAYVLSTRISDGKGFVNVWDTGGAGKIVNVQLPKQTDVLALDDLVSAGGANAVTVLGLRTTDNVGRVFVYDAFTAAKLWAASQAPGRVPVDIKAYTDGSGNVRVAALQLRTSDQRPIVTIYDGDTGALETNVFYESGEPLALTIYPDVSGNNEPELGVLFADNLRLRDSVTGGVASIISVP